MGSDVVLKGSKAKKPRNAGKALDRIISAIAPGWGLKRAQARAVLEILPKLAKLSAYTGAANDRVRGKWAPGSYWETVDDELLDDIQTLRDRSRDLVRNSALASGILDTMVANICGTGAMPTPAPRAQALQDILGAEELEAFCEKVQEVWATWTAYADVTDRTNWGGLLALIERAALESGDVFVHWLYHKDDSRPLQLCLEILEADRIAEKEGEDELDRGGVVVNKYNAPRGFWIRSKNVKKPRWMWRRKDGRLICQQHYYRLRPGQNRGIPLFAPVLTLFDHLESYLEAEAIGARVAAAIALIITTTAPLGAAMERAGRTTLGKRIEGFAPGEVLYLNPDEKFELVNPQRPGASFEAFCARIVRLICRGIGLSYEIGALDFSKSTYSASRASIIEARRFFTIRRQNIRQGVAEPTYAMVIEEAYLNGMFPMISKEIWKTYHRELCRAEWAWAPGWGWVDPVKEIQASRDAVEAGFSTKQKEAASWAGTDYLDNVAAQAREDAAAERIQKKIGGTSPKEPEEEPDS